MFIFELRYGLGNGIVYFRLVRFGLCRLYNGECNKDDFFGEIGVLF